MNLAGIPARFQLPFGKNAGGAYTRVIPLTTATPGEASLDQGFPPITFVALNAGGIPPSGADLNGLLEQTTAWSQWQAAGGPVTWDSTFCTAISGYPQGAVLMSATIPNLYWQNLVDGNITNPDDPSTTANWVPFTRVRLTQATSFYVSKTTGNDVTGIGTSGNPWLTVQHAINVISTFYDWAGQTVSIVRMDSLTYTDTASITGRFVGQTSPLVITASSATNVIVTGSGSQIYLVDAGAWVQIQNHKVTGGAVLLYCTRGSLLSHSGMSYGSCSAAQILCDRLSNVIQNGNNTISGSAAAHASVNSGGNLEINSVNNLTGTPAFTAFAICSGGLLNANGASFTGSGATGSRFAVSNGGTINTNGGGANFFPGNSPGTGTNPGVSPYGLYV